jgi:hypothetical protein
VSDQPVTVPVAGAQGGGGHVDPTCDRGVCAVPGYRTWYQVVGDIPAAGPKLPLLVAHNGPGFPHDYLGDLAQLSAAGRPVVFYDQLDAGTPIIPMTPPCG